MNKQEYYDLLVKTSKEGGFPSVDENTDFSHCAKCMYRSSEGKKCAVGLLIGDDLYEEDMENTYGVRSLLNRYPECESILPEGLDWQDLSSIQVIHDTAKCEWNHKNFMVQLNYLICFKDVVQQS